MIDLGKTKEFEQRTVDFGVDAIRFCKSIPETTISRPIINQLVRSATSIGANYAEANNASSRRDFANKISICRKECQETKHWLLMAGEFEADGTLRDYLMTECQELILIFNRISSTLRNGKLQNAK